MYIQELARLSGVSTRTLRYYDQIGLLIPMKKEDTGYRVYNQGHVDRLQQILFYRELDMPLAQIKAVLDAEGFEQLESLRYHQRTLQQKQRHITELLETVIMTIQSIEEGITMSNEQKFEVFKQQLIDENEAKYGAEIREKYENESVKASYGMVKNMTEEQYEAAQQLEKMLLERLKEAMEEGDVQSDIAVEVAELHKRWLSFYWPKYTKEAHIGLAQMYIADQRFTDYYDSRVNKGATQFLADAIVYYGQLK
ncbi:MerR family transcriptional regulator [Lysinibacillus sp. KU-BSD001]|uniref:MerR family transcriptional regulator n=1 Tax=Lysinibacillus sp. KU-BSD001 TaxID=3141328 RepID=UPI0036E07543